MNRFLPAFFFYTFFVIFGMRGQSPVRDSALLFDPQFDPIGKIYAGSLHLLQSELILCRSLKTRFPQVGGVDDISKQTLENGDYIIFKCRRIDDIEHSFFIAIRMKKSDDGYYYSDRFWSTCDGQYCSDCNYSYRMGCFCMGDRPDALGEPGFCNHSWGDDYGLEKVSDQ